MPKLVNVDKLLQTKGKKIYPYIPGFLIRYLEKKIHQDTLNELLHRFQDKHGLEFLENILHKYFTVEIEVRNKENIPRQGRYILASNHPLGGLDGMALMHEVGKYRKDIKFIVNDILLELQNLQELFVPVNKHGRNSAERVQILRDVYESDNLVLIFPAGLVSRKQNGVIKDLEWKKSFISKSIQYKRDILPVYIEGKNSDFFYNLALWRKRLRIKANIEMLYLPDEMFKQADKKITITFGKPIPYNTFTSSSTHYEWAQWVKEKIYEM
ncbi:MAG: 1-acyl-sn-glycerol-3-phosphate acyltransferase, partial [Bacteroidota bacterium]